MSRCWSFAALAGILGMLAAPLEADSLTFEEAPRPPSRRAALPLPHAGKEKHGLGARQRWLLVRGGNSGAAIVPGRPVESHLLKRISAGEMLPAGRREASQVGFGVDPSLQRPGNEEELLRWLCYL